ncbi:MAG: heavy metal translocating P-type ATPase, partial [Eubacterium sp.]|nr:heavy metal translocating P-type ATPase [Eubacterium sp.]
MNKKQKKMLISIIISAALLIFLNIFEKYTPLLEIGIIRFAAYMVPYIIIGYDILIKAFKGIKNIQDFDAAFLIDVAPIGGIVLSLYSCIC